MGRLVLFVAVILLVLAVVIRTVLAPAQKDEYSTEEVTPSNEPQNVLLLPGKLPIQASVVVDDNLDDVEAIGATELISIGDYIDPEGDPNVGRESGEEINLGEYIDPEGDPNLGREPSVYINIGEDLDPEGDPNIGREPSPYTNIGEFIDADEFFYGKKGAEKEINIGKPLDPEKEN